MVKFIRWTFTVLGIFEFIALILSYKNGVIIRFSSMMTILGSAIIFTFLGYIPQNIYKKYQEELFLKEEKHFLKEKRK